MEQISSLIQEVVYGMVAPAIITALGGLAVVYLRKFLQAVIKRVEAATDYDVSEKLESQIDTVVVRSVKAIEEMAKAKVKDLTGDKKKEAKLSGGAKLNLAIASVTKGLAGKGIKLASSEIQDRIHDVVDSLRNDRMGSLGE